MAKVTIEQAYLSQHSCTKTDFSCWPLSLISMLIFFKYSLYFSFLCLAKLSSYKTAFVNHCWLSNELKLHTFLKTLQTGYSIVQSTLRTKKVQIVQLLSVIVFLQHNSYPIDWLFSFVFLYLKTIFLYFSLSFKTYFIIPLIWWFRLQNYYTITTV